MPVILSWWKVIWSENFYWCKWIALSNDKECHLQFCDTLFHFRVIHYFVWFADDVILFAQSMVSVSKWKLTQRTFLHSTCLSKHHISPWNNFYYTYSAQHKVNIYRVCARLKACICREQKFWNISFKSNLHTESTKDYVKIRFLSRYETMLCRSGFFVLFIKEPIYHCTLALTSVDVSVTINTSDYKKVRTLKY